MGAWVVALSFGSGSWLSDFIIDQWPAVSKTAMGKVGNEREKDRNASDRLTALPLRWFTQRKFQGGTATVTSL